MSANSGETLIYSIASKDKKILYKKQEYKMVFLWCSSAAWIDIYVIVYHQHIVDNSGICIYLLFVKVKEPLYRNN